MKNINIYNVKDDDVYKLLKENEPLKLAYHHDADGISSAALIASMFEVKMEKPVPEKSIRGYPYVPNKFGDYCNGDVAVDCGAPPEDYNGVLVIDHHDHPDKPTYPLVLGYVPTGVTIYHILKDHIPAEKLWLVAMSAVGDGQPEVVPDEVWDAFPELLTESGSVYRDMKYNLKCYPYPVYAKLSTPVNALCRIGSAGKAFEMVNRAESFREVIDNPLGKEAQKMIQMEENRMYMDKANPLSIEKLGKVSLVTYYSKYNLSGRIGANLTKTDKNSTFVIINGNTGEASIRGILAKYVANKLTDNGIQAGGHAGFAGISLTDMQTADDIIDVLRKVFI